MAQQTYQPLPIVTSSNKILHLDYQLQPTKNDFGVTYNSQWNSYTQSLLPIPMILATLGLIALIILNISLLTRAICGYCKCAPGERYYKNGHIDYNVWVNKDLFSMNRLIKVFYISAFLAIILDQALFIGNQYITQGINQGIQSLNSLSTTFTNLDTHANSMETSSTILSQSANQCGSNASSINSTSTIISHFNFSIDTFLLHMSDIPSQINSKSDILSEYGTDLKNQVVWILYGAVILILFSYEFGLWNSNKRMLQISIFISQLLILAFIIICAFEMMTVMLLADFCVDPAMNSLQLVNPSASIYPTVSYYTTCTGINPLSSPILNMSTSLSQMNSKVNTIITQNQCSSMITASLQSEMNAMYNNYYAITNNTQCAMIQSSYTSILYNNLCSQTFSGLYIIWISQYITIAFVFIATVTASIIYQLFGRYWDFDIDDGTFAEDSPSNSEFREDYVNNNFKSHKNNHHYNDMHNNNNNNNNSTINMGKHHSTINTQPTQMYDDNNYDEEDSYNNNNYNNNNEYDANYNNQPFPHSLSHTVPLHQTLHLQQPRLIHTSHESSYYTNQPPLPRQQRQLSSSSSSSQRNLAPLQYSTNNHHIYANNTGTQNDNIHNTINGSNSGHNIANNNNNNNNGYHNSTGSTRQALSEHDNIDRFYEVNYDDDNNGSNDNMYNAPLSQSYNNSNSNNYNNHHYSNNSGNMNTQYNNAPMISQEQYHTVYNNNNYNNNNNNSSYDSNNNNRNIYNNNNNNNNISNDDVNVQYSSSSGQYNDNAAQYYNNNKMNQGNSYNDGHYY